MTQREAEVILKVNSREAEDKLGKLQTQAAELRERFAEAFRKGDTRGIDTINKQLQKVNKEIDNMRTNAANIRAAMVRLDQASPRELQRTMKLINNELNSGRVKRGTTEWDDYVTKLKQVQTELKKVKKEMEPDSEESFLERINNGINDWGATAAAGAAAFAGVVMSGKAAVQAYADMEQEMANVRKFTGMTAEEVEALNEEFKKMDTRTSREDLNKLAQEAGRLGKSSQEDVLGFVRAADKINVALDDLGNGATLTLSKLTGIFGDEKRLGTEKSLLAVGSVINELSQNCSASAPYIAEFASRMGGVGAQAGMTVQQIMGFAAVLDTNNQKLEASSTALSQVIVRIYQDPAKYARVAGMDVEKFANLVKTDMNAALIEFLSTLKQAGNMDVLSPMFKDMGENGSRAISALSTLANHIEEVKSQQLVANDAFREATSIDKEAEVQNNTVQAQLEKARKGFFEMAVDLGKQLLPVMRYCISSTSLLMRVMSTLVTFFIKHRTTILTLTAAFTAYNVVMALHVNWTKLSTMWTGLWSAAQTKLKDVVAVGRLAVAALTNTFQYFTKGLQVNYTMQERWRKAMAGMSFASWTGAIIGLASAVFLMYRHFKRLEEERRVVENIQKEAIKKLGEERVSIDLLVEAARDERLSLDERKKAIDRLNSIIPGYNGLLDETTGKYQENKEALDKYLESLTKQYEIEGAKTKLEELGKKKADATLNLDDAAKAYEAAKKTYEAGGSNTYTTAYGTVGNMAAEAYNNAKRRLDAAEAEMKAVEALENRIKKVYGEDLKKNAVAQVTKEETPPEIPGIEPVVNDTPDESTEKNNAATDALKKALEERKNLYLKAEAENLALYVTGQQNYADYLTKKEKLEREYTDDVVEIHEKHDRIDIAGYNQALKSKANLLKKEEDEQRKREEAKQKEATAERKRRLEALEAEHKYNTDAATADYFDPSSAMFQNKKALNQRLLQEDVRYLKEKQQLYTEESEEWADISQQIYDRIEQDRLDKQKETAEALLAFEDQYSKSSGSRREQIELEMLEELHRQKLISEERYQKAVQAIKRKYREEDKRSSKEAHSEYGDMLNNLYTSLKEFFENLGQEGSNFWGNLGDIMQSAVAITGAVISQYSAYLSAERDLELAKTEKRYDKEIAAAGKNNRKKKKLEEQKEAEMAKIKKKYNDRAMKMEIAQAIAQTAIAAINAYASAAKTAWWLGPVAAAMATAAGMMQVATIKKQHEAQAAGYYEGGFTSRSSDNRREVGVVHANEFVANHQAVANPALAPVLRLIDTAQRNNTVGSLTAADVSNAIGQGLGVSARGDVGRSAVYDSALIGGLSAVAQSSIAANEVMNRLSDVIEGGIEAKVILDGEDGFHTKYSHFLKLRNNPKR